MVMIVKIGELKSGMSGISVQGKVVDISETRNVQTRYGQKTVADAVIEDETGQISLTLWEDNINTVSVGDTVSVNGAFTTQFRDKLQLNVPRSGKIEVDKG